MPSSVSRGPAEGGDDALIIFGCNAVLGEKFGVIGRIQVEGDRAQVPWGISIVACCRNVTMRYLLILDSAILRRTLVMLSVPSPEF